jgi:hypothetical protein
MSEKSFDEEIRVSYDYEKSAMLIAPWEHHD